MALADLGVTLFYRAVTNGQLFESAATKTHAASGRDLKPYAPVRVRAAWDGGDIDIEWNRRTRIGGQLADGPESVPLNEATESYEVDILDGPGGAVLRTLTSSTQAVTYTAAQIAADLGSSPPPDSLTARVYQMSEAVGRGFAHEWTVEIE